MKRKNSTVLQLAKCVAAGMCVFGLLFGVTNVAQADLYGWWKLDDGPTSEDVAKDSGPRGVDGEIFDWDVGGLAGDGSVWVDDPDRGWVLGLSGDTAWVNAGFLPMMDLDNDFSWAFWARQDPGQNTPANDIILGNRYGEFGADTSPREFIKFTPNRFEYHLNGAGSNDLQYFEDGADPDRHIPSNDEWIHHAVAKDGDTLTYYRDGEFGNEGFIADAQFSADPFPFAIGGQDGRETWIGYLSDVRLYDNALTQSEIQAIMSGEEPGETLLQAGDANMDLEFNQLDLVQVQIAAKYLTGQAATWGEGDWNGAPGGSQGAPPTGDNLFNQLDIIAALNAGKYLTGPYAAIGTDGVPGDGQTSISYDPATGEVGVDAPAGVDLTSVNIDSAAGIFTGDPAQNLGGSFDNDADNNIFKATFGSSFGSLSFGTVAQAGLSEEFVANDLTVVGSLNGGGDLGAVDLIYVPEPSALVLFGFGLAGMLLTRMRKRD